MQPKKNPNADHSKTSSLYFVIGLTVILFFTWRAIEWKTYATVYGYEALNIDDDDDEDVPITEQIKVPPPPPPPPPAPEIIEVVEDEEEVEETVIESTETDQEEIVEIEELLSSSRVVSSEKSFGVYSSSKVKGVSFSEVTCSILSTSNKLSSEEMRPSLSEKASSLVSLRFKDVSF